MRTLMIFVRYEVEFLLAALGAVVAFQIITGRITTKGLLTDKKGAGRPGFSTARLQLLMSTGALAFYILGKVMSSVASGQPQFPTIDPNMLVILGGSQALFLGAKAMPASGSSQGRADN